jgi:hypothetical protein
MTKIILTNLVGSYPLRVYVSDIYGSNESFLGQINTSFTGSTEYNLPTVFDYAPQVTIKIVDSFNEIVQKQFNCNFNCELIVDISIVS